MLPRSCLRLADSKSNSSTRFPRTTTPRVSSGCVASMSILLAMNLSLGGAAERARPAPERRRAEDGMRRTGLWVETIGRACGMQRTRIRGLTAAQSDFVGHPPHDGDLTERQHREGAALRLYCAGGI